MADIVPQETQPLEKPIQYEVFGKNEKGETVYTIYDPQKGSYQSTVLPTNNITSVDEAQKTATPAVEVADPVETAGIDVSTLTDEELSDLIKENQDALDILNNGFSQQTGPLSEEQKRVYEAVLAERNVILAEGAKRNPQCVKKESDNSYTFKDTPECEQFVNSVIGNNLAALAQKKYSMPDPCGTSEMAKINTQLQKFFITLKGIKKYGNLYVNGIVNKTSNLVSLVRSTSTIIASVLKGLVQRFRNYVLYKIRRGIIDVIDKLFPNLASQLKNTVIQKIVDSILCKFKDIIKGLKDLVIDFLFELIGKIANAPFCVAEQFTNALVNNLGASIDEAIGPVLDEISDVLGGATKFAGQIFEALDFIIGFESFLCAKPNCPEIKEYAAGPWGGPSPTNPNAFEKFLASPDLDAGEAAQFINDTLNNTLGLGFLDKGVGGESIGTAPGSVTDCSTAPFRCGPPTVEFFGGGGIGAVGSAVVDTTGQILGVDLVFGGSNYTRPPFVTFMDSCGRGEYASGYTKINDNGQITEVVMVNNGSGYMNTVDGTTEFDDDPADTTVPFPVEQKVTDYVVCLKEIQVISTGIGYQPTDEITITPDIPNLQARVKMTQDGQIIAIDVLEEACNLTTIPEITINSLTGGGLEVRPILTFTRIEDFDRLAGAPAPQDLVRVIDCVS